MRHFPVFIALFLAILSLTPAIGHAKSDAEPAGSFEIRIEKVYYAMQGHLVNVAIEMDTGAEMLGGFDFLIGFNSSALTLTDAALGTYLDGCGWEYFTYRYMDNSDCGDGCPTGLVRLNGLADDPDTPDKPDSACISSAAGHEIARLTFYISEDRRWECMFMPVSFYWTDCHDNLLISHTGDTSFVNQEIYDIYGNRIDNPEFGFPGYFGITDSCVQNDTGILIPDVTFIAGGVDFDCGRIYDFRGDINANGIGYEVADAVMYINVFICSLSLRDCLLAVFDGHVEASLAASDVNGDGIMLTVSDLVYLIRGIIGDDDLYPKPAGEDTAQVIARGGDVSIKTPTDLGAVLLTFRVDGDVEPRLHVDMNMKYSCTDGYLRLLIYDLGTRSIPAGNTPLVSVPGATLTKAEAASYYGFPVGASIDQLPMNFALSQNVPNPFNAATTISMALPVESDWSMEIFNVAGQLIRRFAGHNQAGSVEITWDGRDENGQAVASGIYLYRAAAGSFTASRKMVLIK